MLNIEITVKPVIEALFFEYNDKFRKLVSSIAESDCAALHYAFVKSFNSTDIPYEIFSPWDLNLKSNIESSISVISTYGNKLCEKHIPRGDHAVALASELSECLKTLPLTDDTPTSKVKWLNFKFKFVTTLHAKDHFFEGHRGWKKVIGNVASLIFSVGILNIINFCVTGNFFFFNQTTTQELVTNLDKPIKSEQFAFNI